MLGCSWQGDLVLDPFRTERVMGIGCSLLKVDVWNVPPCAWQEGHVVCSDKLKNWQAMMLRQVERLACNDAQISWKIGMHCCSDRLKDWHAMMLDWQAMMLRQVEELACNDAQTSWRIGMQWCSIGMQWCSIGKQWCSGKLKNWHAMMLRRKCWFFLLVRKSLWNAVCWRNEIKRKETGNENFCGV